MQRLNKGFTLIELITVMSIAVILLAIGVPNLMDFINSSRASSEHREFVRAVGLARSEAITRATDVNVSTVTGTDWADGLRIWVDEDNDATFDAGEELRVFSGFGSNASLKATGNKALITFTSDGLLNEAQGTTITFAYRTSPAKCSRDRNILLRHTGHVSVEERGC